MGYFAAVILFFGILIQCATGCSLLSACAIAPIVILLMLFA